MKGEQMNLFDVRAKAKPMTAEVVAFPIDRHLVLVRETARQLERRQGKLAEKHWKTECNRLAARLQVQGLAMAEIKIEIDRFAIAVQAEMQRAAWAEWRRNHDGDAA